MTEHRARWLAELFHQIELGKAKGDEMLPVSVPSHQQTGPGARLGVLCSLKSVSEMSIHDLAVLTLAYADPTAINALIDRLTLEEINDTAQSLGATHTQLARKIGYAAPPENYTTASDVAAVWSALIKADDYSPATKSCSWMTTKTARS